MALNFFPGAALSALCVAALMAQDSAAPPRGRDQTPIIVGNEGGSRLDRIKAPYLARPVPPVDFNDSNRLESLLRAGRLYLSLADAIALALENNLDIELQRFNSRIAQTDVLRAQGGGLPRGVQTTIRELPAGVGGPGSTLLTTVGGTAPATNLPANYADPALITEQTADLSAAGVFAPSAGPRIPGFDPALTGQLSWAHQTAPQTTTFVTGASSLLSNNVTGNFGFLQGFSSGAEVNLGYNSLRQDTNAARSNYNPYTNASLGLTVTQPLLQGFGVALNRRFIRIAKNNQRMSDAFFRQQLIDTVAGVVRLYWDLASLTQDVQVKEQALAASRQLYENNQTQVEVGTLAPLELKRAQAEVARSRQDLTNSQNLALQQELLLKNVLTRNGAADPLLREARIVPLDKIEVPAAERPRPVQDLVVEALRNRPDVAGARLQIENARIGLRGSKNALLPEIDLVGSLQNSALIGQPNASPAPAGGTPFVRNPDPFFIGGYGGLLSQIFSRNFPNYSIGLQLTVPLRNRVAQADVARDELQLRQSEIRLRQIDNQVRLEVENALVAVDRARASYAAAVETRQLQEEALAAERERYSVGASTSFFVIQYQRDLAQARSTEVATQGIYAKARAALDRALGETLENNNVQLEEAYQGRVARPPTPLPVLP